MTQDAARTLTPASEEEAAQLVSEARAKGEKLDIAGGGTRAGLGRPAASRARLASAGLSGIVFYEPAEMVVCAQAGTSLGAIEAVIAQRGQMLPFEPMDHRGLYATEGEPTIGGVVAANISGPRRISAGAARDALIGLRLVNGRGETVVCGGRVMKNVTGLDLVKLNCGAHGTLGLVTQATFKVLPRPEAEATIVIRRLDDARAIEALSIALGSPFGVSGAAHLSAGMGREFPRTFARIEGFRASVDYRIAALLGLLRRSGQARAGRRGIAAPVARHPRCDLHRKPERKRDLAHQPRAVERRRFRRAARRPRARAFLRLGRRPGLAEQRADRRGRRRRADRAGPAGRPCDAGSRARRAAPER